MIKVGVWGRPAGVGMGVDLDSAYWVAQSKLAWVWVREPWPREIPAYEWASIVHASGKKVVLRPYFWDDPRLTDYRTWTDLYNNPEQYDTVVDVVRFSIGNFGRENIDAIGFEEEPWMGFQTVPEFPGPFTPEQIRHYIHGHNVIYDKLKEIYPNLPIYCYVVASSLTDDEIRQLKLDGLIQVTYQRDLDGLEANMRRYVNLADEMGWEKLSMIFASTGTSWEPNCDPAYIRPVFERAVAAGMRYICFFASNYNVSGREECILYNDDFYEPAVMTGDEEIDRIQPYLHRQAMLELIEQYAEVPPPERGWAIPDFVMNAIFIMLMMTVVKKAL